MMVDSRATTAPPRARAAATSGATATPVDICAMLPESWYGKQREEFQCRRPPEQRVCGGCQAEYGANGLRFRCWTADCNMPPTKGRRSLFSITGKVCLMCTRTVSLHRHRLKERCGCRAMVERRQDQEGSPLFCTSG
jgi:hypothetical protein